jgi:hypothetical protein
VAKQTELIYDPPGLVGLIDTMIKAIAARESRDIVKLHPSAGHDRIDARAHPHDHVMARTLRQRITLQPKLRTKMRTSTVYPPYSIRSYRLRNADPWTVTDLGSNTSPLSACPPDGSMTAGLGRASA